MKSWPNLALSHFELYVHDASRMEAFYTQRLGFVVTDRGEGPDALVFLSRNPNEHHQLVLNPQAGRRTGEGPLDHIAFRVASLQDVRAVHAALKDDPGTAIQAVSHGNTWSVYFRDPEGNRLEVFADTPWQVAQPCRFPIDLSLDDERLSAEIERRIRGLPGFRLAADWQKDHASTVGSGRDRRPR